ncbi:MAG: menaquinone biosynthesis decarboxylase [Bacteroidales bacterium]|nr:menaquinone biosynthesis decarboxylase [Bacteroidales bacterium]
MLKFINKLKANNELVSIDTYVNPILEISEIADRVMKMPDGGKALLFKNNGSKFSLLINAFGSEKRMLMALGVKSFDEIPEKYFDMLKVLTSNKTSRKTRLKLLPELFKTAKFLPKTSRDKGQCQEVIHTNPDLNILPILQCWPYDGGKFITLPLVISKHPETGVRNLGMYRMQIFDKQTCGMHWHLHKGGAAHYDEYKKQNKIMPIAVALGGDPVYTYMATAPLPDGIDEFIAAGILRQKPVKMLKCISQDIEVPADADIVIEGYIDPNEDLQIEGPFGDHTGMYSLADKYPVFHVTCITHKQNAVYPATIVGVPPMEDKYLALATEKLFFHPIKLMHPEILDMHLPYFGVAHNLVIFKIKSRYKGQALKIMHSMLGNGQMMFAKVLVCVDNDFSFEDEKSWLSYVLSRINWQNNLQITRGPADVLDHAAYKFAYGGKLLIDASEPSKSENNDFKIEFISIESELDFEALISKFKAESSNKSLIVFLPEETKNLSPELKAWYVLGSIDPHYDCKIIDNCLFINSLVKTKQKDNFNRDWPNVVCMNDETIHAIDKKWSEISNLPFVESPSLAYKDLISGDSAIFKVK